MILFDAVMDVFTYRTIDKSSQGFYREKGSKFHSFAYPVNSEKEVKEKIDGLKKEYFDARHHCFAWMLGPEKKAFRAFDDGEPNHSAGDPILGQIRSKDITNVLIAVVRYFGGVKLGVGGLITAYKNAAEDALSNATIIEVETTYALVFEFDYSFTPEVMRMVKEFELRVTRQHFATSCQLMVQVPMRMKKRLTEKIEFLQATGTALKVSD
jgi:uncharacterized YigZ family protein